LNEKQLFEYIADCCYPDLVKAKKQMSRWDCYSPESRHRIELKCRRVHYETLIIEKPKYESIIKKCKDNNDVPIYINSTPMGVYRFNLSNFDPVWETKYLNKTTDFTNRAVIPKEIYMLPVIDAETI
tara:strand:+ start:15337 stop:15717 length:381 start_codon:yes stop_codon:yes gene_type:complete